MEDHIFNFDFVVERHCCNWVIGRSKLRADICPPYMSCMSLGYCVHYIIMHKAKPRITLCIVKCHSPMQYSRGSLLQLPNPRTNPRKVGETKLLCDENHFR